MKTRNDWEIKQELRRKWNIFHSSKLLPCKRRPRKETGPSRTVSSAEIKMVDMVSVARRFFLFIIFAMFALLGVYLLVRQLVLRRVSRYLSAEEQRHLEFLIGRLDSMLLMQRVRTRGRRDALTSTDMTCQTTFTPTQMTSTQVWQENFAYFKTFICIKINVNIYTVITKLRILCNKKLWNMYAIMR